MYPLFCSWQTGIELNHNPLLENNVVLTLHYAKKSWKGRPSGFYIYITNTLMTFSVTVCLLWVLVKLFLADPLVDVP